jgi:NADH:ubiquinone oxidoreductase subunit H
MISYEIALGTTIVSVILLSGTLNFTDIVEAQANT